MLIKERIKEINKCIFLLEMIKDNVNSVILEAAINHLYEKLTELKEVFILSVTYNEVV